MTASTTTMLPMSIRRLVRQPASLPRGSRNGSIRIARYSQWGCTDNANVTPAVPCASAAKCRAGKGFSPSPHALMGIAQHGVGLALLDHDDHQQLHRILAGVGAEVPLADRLDDEIAGLEILALAG